MAHRLSEVGVGDAVLLDDLSMNSFVENLRIRSEINFKFLFISYLNIIVTND
jgi:hypothetical protein